MSERLNWYWNALQNAPIEVQYVVGGMASCTALVAGLAGWRATRPLRWLAGRTAKSAWGAALGAVKSYRLERVKRAQNRLIREAAGSNRFGRSKGNAHATTLDALMAGWRDDPELAKGQATVSAEHAAKTGPYANSGLDRMIAEHGLRTAAMASPARGADEGPAPPWFIRWDPITMSIRAWFDDANDGNGGWYTIASRAEIDTLTGKVTGLDDELSRTRKLCGQYMNDKADRSEVMRELTGLKGRLEVLEKRISQVSSATRDHGFTWTTTTITPELKPKQ